MVVFVCSGCGTTLKKNQVDYHPYKCRNCQYVTCMDCGKDFWGNDYASHYNCMTEDQKYGGVNYVAKENTGQKKQDEWVTHLRDGITAAQGLNPELKKLLENTLQFDNIPRKRAKFLNFLRNNSNNRSKHLFEEAWKFIETVLEKKRAEASTSSNNKEHSNPSSMEVEQAEEVVPPRKSKRERKEERQKNQTKVQKKDKKKRALEDIDDDGNQESEKPKKKKKKNRREEEGSNQENEEPESLQNQSTDQEAEEINCSVKASPFKWKKAIATVLQDAPEEGMKMKKLKRKVFALYVESKAQDTYRKSDIEIEALITKKLQCRNDKYIVHKDRVKLRKSD